MPKLAIINLTYHVHLPQELSRVSSLLHRQSPACPVPYVSSLIIQHYARKGRRRARPERRRNAKTSQNVARARSRTGELNIATWNVRSLSLTGRRGPGHAEVLLQKCKVLGCDVIGLQETRRPGRTEFATAEYRVFCSGVDGSTGRAG